MTRCGRPASSNTSSSAELRWQPFPTDVLPRPLRRFVREGAKAIGCDESFVALPALAAVAGAVGTSTVLVVKRGWAAPALLWTATVGESGTSKSQGFKLAMGPVRERQRGALRRFQREWAEYETATARHAEEMRAWKKSDDGGDPPSEPVPPKRERTLVSDPTVESLAPILRENPRGLLLARDELAGWVHSFGQYKAKGKSGADVAHWLSMFDADTIVVDRKTPAQPTLFVPLAGVSVAGGIQPGALRRVLGREHRENGLAARLLLACPPRRAAKWHDAEVDEDTERVYADILDRLHALELGTHEDGDPKPTPVGMTNEARAAFIVYHDRNGAEQVELTGDLAAAWSKLRGYALRLALLVHLVEWAAGTRPSPGTLDVEAIQAGITLAEWFTHETERVYAILDESVVREGLRVGDGMRVEESDLGQPLAVGRGESFHPRGGVRVVRLLQRPQGDQPFEPPSVLDGRGLVLEPRHPLRPLVVVLELDVLLRRLRPLAAKRSPSTANHYLVAMKDTHANLFDLAAAVDAMPALPTRPTEPVEDTRKAFPLRATGTTDATPNTGSKSLPLGLPAQAAFGGISGRERALSDGPRAARSAPLAGGIRSAGRGESRDNPLSS